MAIPTDHLQKLSAMDDAELYRECRAAVSIYCQNRRNNHFYDRVLADKDFSVKSGRLHIFQTALQDVQAERRQGSAGAITKEE